MSATLRYDISLALRAALDPGGEFLPREFAGYPASRWGGVGKPRWECFSFAVALPRQAAGAWRLLQALCEARGSADRSVWNGGRILAGKVAASLGLDPGVPPSGDEAGFLKSIAADPGELTAWSAYADWLGERDDEGRRDRGALVAGWLAPKPALKVKYGVIVTPSDRYGSRYRGFRWCDTFVELVGGTVPDIFEELT